MRATRAFWQDEPVVWMPVGLLSQYSPPPFAKCTLPIDDDLLRAVVRSSDSAPGLDGLPYAAYRGRLMPHPVCLRTVYMIMSAFKHRSGTGLSLYSQADAGSYADNFRPLGLPYTADRIIDQAVYVQMYSALRGSLHAFVNIFREPHANFLDMQTYLGDRGRHTLCCCLNFAKAFELPILNAPVWVLQYATYGRSVLFELLPSNVRMGVRPAWFVGSFAHRRCV